VVAARPGAVIRTALIATRSARFGTFIRLSHN
jgi:hypothetical protein